MADRDSGLPQEVYDPPLTTHDRVYVSMGCQKIVDRACALCIKCFVRNDMAMTQPFRAER